MAKWILLAFYGTEQSGLADDRLNVLLKCIAGENEGRFFRESLVRLLRQRYWRQLTNDQRMQCKQKFFAVLSDKKAPAGLRALICRELSLAIAENHRDIITADKNVKPLRSDKQKWWNLDDLVRKGEVRLDPETRKSLKSVRDEIQSITPTLTALSRDTTESPEVKKRAESALKTFTDLPEVSEKQPPAGTTSAEEEKSGGFFIGDASQQTTNQTAVGVPQILGSGKTNDLGNTVKP